MSLAPYQGRCPTCGTNHSQEFTLEKWVPSKTSVGAVANPSELESLRQQLAECHATNGKLREALDAVQQVANRSEGIAGWHLNGDIASWYSILPEVDEALALPNDATALSELITERTKTQKEYYESVFQDGANRIAELTAEVEYWKTIRTENAVYFEKREAELTAQRDVAIEPPSRLLAKVGSNAGLGVSPREEQDGNV